MNAIPAYKVSATAIHTWNSAEDLGQLFPVKDSMRVRELRLTFDLYKSLAERADFQLAFDPQAVQTALNQGYLGTLYGAEVFLLPDPIHARQMQWPAQTFMVLWSE